MPYSDLPEPKFLVGQAVWLPDTTMEEATLPCPDCLGTKVWRVETPAGGSYEVACQRCAGGYTFNRQDDVAPLQYRRAVASPKAHVIKSVEVRTNDFGDGPMVRYDGYAESSLFVDEAGALAASQLRASEHNAKIDATPEMLAARNIGKLKIDDAKYDQFANGLWNAWYAYNSLIEKLDAHLEDKTTLGKDDTEYLKSDIRWEVEYRAKDERPLDTLVEAVRCALAGDPTKLAGAYDGLPEALRREKAAPTAEQVSA
jgi:hypothetical protein